LETAGREGKKSKATARAAFVYDLRSVGMFVVAMIMVVMIAGVIAQIEGIGKV
jgi:hypothetical protein